MGEMWRQRSTDPIARTAISEIEGGAPIANAWELEDLASEVHARARTADLDGLVAAAGCTVILEDALPNGVEAMVLPNGVILARPQRDERRLMLVILHEVAHHIVAKAGIWHSHADVWCLTLALAAPISVLERLRRRGDLTVTELECVVPVSTWALEARLEMPTVTIAA